MPTHKVNGTRLEAAIADFEKQGELVIQVLRQADDRYLVITRERDNDTGNAWLPSSAKETR